MRSVAGVCFQLEEKSRKGETNSGLRLNEGVYTSAPWPYPVDAALLTKRFFVFLQFWDQKDFLLWNAEPHRSSQT
jgi:hypothetical protein